MVLYVGDDWAEDHHDVHLMDESGERLAARRLPEGVAGVTALHALVAQHAAGPGEVVIGIETDRGPWVSALVAAGYTRSTRARPRYRDRHHVGGAKSDAGDAMLADLVRTDRHNHREVAGDSDEAGAVRILARTHQQLIWDRVRQTNRLRRAQGVLSGCTGGLPEACPRRRRGRAVQRARPARGGAAEHLPDSLRAQARRPPAQHRAPRRRGPRGVALPAARGAARSEHASTRAAVGQMRCIEELEAELAASFEQHPDADRSLPGLGVVLGARVLGEFPLSAKSRRNYAVPRR